MSEDPSMERANFGTLLKEERESRKISLAAVSEATKLSVSSLKLMEAGNLDDLPPDVFVRGFIRSYARTLGISSNEPLELLDQLLLERGRAAQPMVMVGQASRRYRSPASDRSDRQAPPAPAKPSGTSLSMSDPGDDDAPRRGIGLAVFVIIVLLIATITLSLFLRQQPQSGERISLGEAVATTSRHA
jgi:cytoskeletal protein RodZ